MKITKPSIKSGIVVPLQDDYSDKEELYIDLIKQARKGSKKPIEIIKKLNQE